MEESTMTRTRNQAIAEFYRRYRIEENTPDVIEVNRLSTKLTESKMDRVDLGRHDRPIDDILDEFDRECVDVIASDDSTPDYDIFDQKSGTQLFANGSLAELQKAFDTIVKHLMNEKRN